MPILIEFDEIAGLSRVKQTFISDKELCALHGLDQDVDFLSISVADDRALEDFSRVEKLDFISKLLKQVKLTKIEHKVLELWSKGASQSEIARILKKKHNESVAFIFRRIIRKLRVAAIKLGEQIDIRAPINFRLTRTRKRVNY